MAEYIKMMESLEPKAIKKLANLDKKCLPPRSDQADSKYTFI